MQDKEKSSSASVSSLSPLLERKRERSVLHPLSHCKVWFHLHHLHLALPCTMCTLSLSLMFLPFFLFSCVLPPSLSLAAARLASFFVLGPRLLGPSSKLFRSSVRLDDLSGDFSVLVSCWSRLIRPCKMLVLPAGLAFVALSAVSGPSALLA